MGTRDYLQFERIGAHVDSPTISSATILTPTASIGITKLLIQTMTQNVRYTLDGTTPTASLGFQLKAGDPPIIIPVDSSNTITVIQEAATADLNYQWGH